MAKTTNKVVNTDNDGGAQRARGAEREEQKALLICAGLAGTRGLSGGESCHIQ